MKQIHLYHHYRENDLIYTNQKNQVIMCKKGCK
jgi:hypothetical protein